MRRLFALLAVLALAILPAGAAAQRQEMIASAAFTASGTSAAFSVNSATQLFVGVDITVATGTTPAFSAWLQGSDDGGTTWYDLPADLVLVSTTAAAGNSVTANQRNVANNQSASGQHTGIYKSLPADRIRLRWVISGTTPSFTFSASYVAK